MNVQVCKNPSDAVVLYLPQHLYLKAFAKINISVQLPSIKVHGKAISNWEVMEKLRNYILPESFSSLKVLKNSSEVIRFDAELENPSKLEKVLRQLDDRVMQLTDYPETLKVRACEAKSEIPTRHSWDSFFRDATDMDEMKPGERPDTIHLTNLPVRWFVHPKDNDENAMPSESIFKRVFDRFGSVRQVDIPISDPFRLQMKSSMRGMTVPLQTQKDYFEGYVQFSEYVGFVRCLDALRGCKLMKKGTSLSEWCGFTATFDKTKHMTDAAIKRRSIVRDRLIERQRAKEEEEKQEKDKLAKKEAKERMKQTKAEREKLERMREREERRKKRQLAKLVAKDNVDVDGKYAEEYQKLVRTQRKLQAIRLIEELFNRIELRGTSVNGSSHRRYYSSGLSAERRALVTDMKMKQEKAVEEQADLLQKAKEGRLVIRSVLETKKPKPRTSSISSISSEEFKDVVKREPHSPDREYDYKKAGMNMWPPGFGIGVPPPYGPVYYAPPHPAMYGVRWAGRARGTRPGVPRGRGGRGFRPRMPHYDGPDANTMYYHYFKKLHESESRNEHDDRARRRSYSRERSRRRSYSRDRRSRSRSSRSRSRSRSRRSRSHKRRSRSRSHRTKSRSRSHRSRSRSRSHRSRSHSRSHRSRSHHSQRKTEEVPRRSKSWSLPKEGENGKSWSKSPKPV